MKSHADVWIMKPADQADSSDTV